MTLGRPTPVLLLASLALAASAHAGVRAIALQGDPAPGVAAATFASFPTANPSGYPMPPLCDSIGHCAFYATTSTGVAGIWSDMTGALAPVVLVGDVLPGAAGPDTVTSPGLFLMSDHGQVVFYAFARHGTATYGLWYRDASGVTLAAEDGESCPWLGSPTSWNLGPTIFRPGNNAGPIALNGSGRLALLDTTNPTPSSHDGYWTFDPPPLLSAQVCAQDGFVVGTPSFTALGLLSFNASSYFAALENWYDGSAPATRGIFMGACGNLGSVLTDGDLAPPVGDIPHTANVQELEGNLPPDINSSREVAFTSWLVNGGVTTSNNEVQWLFDGNGFHEVLREGGTSPDLSGGETLTPNTYGSGTADDMPSLVSDLGWVAFNATIQPSNAPAVMVWRPDGSLHVVARDMTPVPGLVGRLYQVAFDHRTTTGLSMNHSGQLLMQTMTRDASDPSNPGKFKAAVFTTDLSGAMTLIVLDQSTYTVRTGLTGLLSNLGQYSFPLPSNGTDGRWHNFSNKGEYAFDATFTPGGGSPLGGVFMAGGPDVSVLGVPPTAAVATHLSPVAPDPASGPARVAFELARDGAVRLEVLDLAGRHVRTLLAGALAAGAHEARWAGDDDAGRAVARGVYFVRLRAPGADVAQRMVLLK